MNVEHGGMDGEGAARQEIEGLFDERLRAAAAKDIVGAMRPIADDIVSYEHNTPLRYVGRASVREVCQEGFDYMEGDFTWDVPDLKVLVRGDLAVTWGLNRMTAHRPDGSTVEQWSRGTRIFQRRNGKWSMIHQHVSFPYDPATGLAVMDAPPEPA